MASSIADLLLKIEAQQGDAVRSVDELAAALEALDHAKAEATAQVDTDQGAFDALQLELEKFDHTKAEAKAGVDTKEGMAQLQLFTHSLENLASKSYTSKFFSAGDIGSLTNIFPHQGQLKMDVDLDTSGATAHAAEFHEQLQLMLDKPVHQKIDVDKSILSETESLISKLTSAFGGLASVGAGAGQMFEKMGENLSSVTVNFGMFGARLGPIVAGLIALAVVIGTSLVSAFIAVASSIGLAVIALGAMATALAAAMAPVALIAIPAVLMFGKVLQALASKQTDQTKAAREAASAIRQKAQADAEARSYAQQHADAEQRLTDALANQKDVQQQGLQAVSDAHQRFVDDQVSGNQQVADAQQRVADSAKNAYRQMQDAINGVTDALLGLQHAQLNVEQSKLNLRKAQEALKDFRKQIGLSSSAFDAMFKNFTDVSFDPAKLNAALKAITGGTTGGSGDATDNELQLEQLILNVRDARLGEKDANQGVKESEQKLTRARQDAQPFIDKGIKGSKDYQAALKSLAQTQHDVAKRLADDTKAIADAQATANKNNIAAARGVSDAMKALNRLESDRAFNLKQQKELQHAANLETDAAKTKTQKLSGEETKLLNAIKGLMAVFSKDFGPAVNAFFDGLIGGFKLLGPAMDKLKGPMTELGKVMGQAVYQFFKMVTSPGALKLFDGMIKGAQQLLPYIDKIFGPMLDILGKIAVAAMPFLVQAFKDMAKWMSDLDKKATVNSIRKWLKDIMPNLSAVVGFVLQAIPSLVSFMKQAGPAGQQFLNWATGAAKQFERWANSKKGRDEIHDFFSKTIPSAIAFFNVLFTIAGWFISATSWISNAWDTWNNFWTKVGGLVESVWEWLGKLVHIDLAGMFDTLLSFALDPINTAYNIGANLGKSLWNGIKSVGVDLIEWILGPFKDAIKALEKWLGISSPSKRMEKIGEDVIQGLINGLTVIGKLAAWIAKWLSQGFVDAVNWLIGLPKTLFNLGKNIISALWNGLTSFTVDVATWIWKNVIQPVVDWLIKLPKDFFNAGKDIINALWNGLTSVVVDVANWIYKNAIKPTIDWLVKLPKSFWDMGVNIAKSFFDGMTSVHFSPGGWLKNALMNGINTVMRMGSPSRVMIDIGQNIGKGLQIGIDNSAKDIQRAAARSLVSPVLTAGAVAGVGASTGPAPNAGAGVVIQNMNLPAAPGYDQMGDPRHQAALFAREMRRRGWR